MKNQNVDLFVIGAGSGGVRAARLAGAMGKKVVIAEERYLGGTCVNVGCVPKKLMVYASHFHEDAEDAGGFGWRTADTRFDWPVFRDRMQAEVRRLNGIYAGILDRSNVERVEGHAELEDAHKVRVGDRTWTAETILIATGGWPSLPDIPGIERAISSNELFALDTLPGRVLVVGGGYIAVEMSCILHDLGVDTTLMYRRDLFLRGFDHDLRTAIRDNMQAKGMNLVFNTNVTALEKDGNGIRATLTDESVLTVDQVLMATGRKPLTQNLGLDRAGVKVWEDGVIPVDAYSRTNVGHIYAVGDVTGRMELTPVAIEEAMAFVKTVFEDTPTQPDYHAVATAIFSQPPGATVGLTEEQARETCDDPAIFLSRFRPLKHTVSGREAKVMMKIIVDRGSDRVLGMHMVGPDAGEIIQGFAAAMKAGLTKQQLDATIGVHPTSAEEFVTMYEEHSPP